MACKKPIEFPTKRKKKKRKKKTEEEHLFLYNCLGLDSLLIMYVINTKLEKGTNKCFEIVGLAMHQGKFWNGCVCLLLDLDECKV